MATRNYLDDQDFFARMARRDVARPAKRAKNYGPDPRLFSVDAELPCTPDTRSSSTELMQRISTLVDGISRLSQSDRLAGSATKVPHGWTLLDSATAILSLTAIPRTPYFSERAVND